jgi:diguanylate cyclase (GGDEF)-like protein
MSASGRIALKPRLESDVLKALRPAWIPAGILAVTALLAAFTTLPAELAGLKVYGPYVLLATGVGLAWRFNRGRAFVLVASLLGAFAAHQLGYRGLLHVIVPLNALLAMALPERGVRYRAGTVWVALIALEGLLITMLPALGLPALAGRVMFAAAFATAVWRAWPEFTPLPVGAAGALTAFYLASDWSAVPGVHAAFMSAAGAILLVSLLEESHRLAFRDILTGLPGRRALEERLRGLSGKYAIAMVDVDHFKKFNDTHGHDIGDQVLKLVGARLGEVGGGGIAYRYGGEEFAVLFPGEDLQDALLYLETIRISIEGYRMAVRSPDRPKAHDHGAKRRGAGAPEKHLSVTVSIGACAPSERLSTPAQVIKAADEALYRAKQGGRNKVST